MSSISLSALSTVTNEVGSGVVPASPLGRAYREGRPVAFAGAALPYIEDELSEGQVSTFLLRCSRYDIGLLDDDATRKALELLWEWLANLALFWWMLL